MNRSASIHLSDCPDCRHFADETSSLLRLISVQPRVEVPADFDFKLRARIARAQSEPRGRAAFFEKLWGRTFSWTQATAALATVGLAVTLTTFHFIHNERPNSTPETVAVNGERAVSVSVNPATIGPAESTPSVPVAVRTASRPGAVKFVSRAAKAPSIIEKSPLIETGRSEIANVTSQKVSDEPGLRVYDMTRAQVVRAPNGNLYGAEGSNLRSTKDIAASF